MQQVCDFVKVHTIPLGMLKVCRVDLYQVTPLPHNDLKYVGAPMYLGSNPNLQ